MAAAASEAREALVGLSRITQDELAAIFAEFRAAGLDPAQTRDALLDLLPTLGTEYHLASSALAADWYDDLRENAEVAGRFMAEPVPPPTSPRWEALARWGVDPLFTESPDWQKALTLIGGGLQRSVADGHRLTVVENSLRDPKAVGWRRIGDGSTCSFCRMLIGRGFVYSESSVTFKSHDNCGCSAAPSWDEGRSVPTVAYRASKRTPSTADRARVRDYLREDT